MDLKYKEVYLLNNVFSRIYKKARKICNYCQQIFVVTSLDDIIPDIVEDHLDV